MVGVMAFLTAGAAALDYAPCHYGVSKLVFRGPRRNLAGRYMVVIGGTETFGKYVPLPFVDQLEQSLEVPVVNLGIANAGPDVFLADDEIARIATGAAAVVVQVLGAHNQTNPYYAVHPRRNDRVLSVSPRLRSLYREVDFAEFHFTRHLVKTLHGVCKTRFAIVAAELQTLWVERMIALMKRLGPHIVLLWTGTQPPKDRADDEIGPRYPALVDRGMMAKVAAHAALQIEICPPAERGAGADAMQAMAEQAGLPWMQAHRRIADTLIPILRQF
jgi:Domain of unknown function (DUF6473)